VTDATDTLIAWAICLLRVVLVVAIVGAAVQCARGVL
jgi:hypothetical protein